ncbi:MAG: ParB/RepB/Spo0J family partition protein [Breznakia sp.]
MITNLLNEKTKELNSSKIMTLPLEDIHPNPLNTAPINDVNELAELISKEGLKNPIIVYKEANHHYILLGGERRYTALKSLDYDEIPAIIVDKPLSEANEVLDILDLNGQRNESLEYKAFRAKEYEKVFYDFKKKGQIKKGVLKIDWIGQRMNVSGRQCQRYLEEKADVENKVNTIQNGKDIKNKQTPTFLSLYKKIEKLCNQLNSDCEFSINEKEVITACESIQYCIDTLEGQLRSVKNERRI